MTRETFQDYGTLSIVGLGLIGGSLALALRRAGYTGRILGVSRRETLDEAIAEGVVDEGLEYDGLVDVASRSDLVVLASPIHRILEHIEELGASGRRLRPGTVVSDVGSTKVAILEAASRALPAGVHFVGGHPMAGSERRGIQAADAFLFQNAFYVLSTAPGTPADQLTRLEGFLAHTGARMLRLDPVTHDRVAALISHVPQLLAVALVSAIDERADTRDDAVRLAAGGFRDMTRIASSPFGMWKDVYETNAKEVRAAVDLVVGRLRSLSARLVDDESLGADFDRAAETRAAIPKDSKGFLRPLWEVLVVVEDRPGIISTIASTLAAASINIKDIEVVKVREDEGGTLRLAFSTQEVAREAIRLLSAEGFAVRLRE